VKIEFLFTHLQKEKTWVDQGKTGLRSSHKLDDNDDYDDKKEVEFNGS
jgi:hypothetical protein